MSRTTRLFLAERAGSTPPRLLPGESEHARRVLRLKEGDACEGLDGEGHRWALRVAAARRDELLLEPVSPPEPSPAPGEPGAGLPWIEVAVSWPRKARGEELIGMLVQLGAAAITPLVAARAGPAPPPAETPERWLKLAREACKQSGRAWMPRFAPPCTPEELAEERTGTTLAVLEPVAGMSLDTWLRSLVPAHADEAGAGLGTAERPIVLAVGPEGGFSPEELDLLRIAGATGVRLAPHVLRIETAAVAAMAVAAATFVR